MSFQNFFKSLTTSTRRRPIRPPASRLRVESLEDRWVPSFSPAVHYAAGEYPQSVQTADFNGDGRLDIAATNPSTSTVSVILGNADGTFQPAQNSATGTSPLSLAVGDFNEDGKLDLATANEGDVSVLLGNGNGTFGAPANINIGSSPSSVAVGDFNADGNLDLGVASSVYYPPQPGDPYYGGGSQAYYRSYANVLLGNGAGTLTLASWTGMGGNYAYAGYFQPTYTAAVADYNTDGRDDFLSTSSDNSHAMVLLANLNGSLGTRVYLEAGYDSPTVVAKDISGDGKADVVATNGNGVTVQLGTGTGAFGPVQYYGMSSRPSSLAVADFNGDGKIDIVTADGGYGTVSVLLGTGGGAFKPPLPDSAGSYPLGVATGDFDRDGRADVAAVGYSANVVSVLFNDGNWLPLNAPSISINDVTVTEGNIGTTSATFTVSLSAAPIQRVSVHYATGGGSAAAGSDYQSISGDLTFTPDGPLTQTVTVPVNGDRTHEYQESFNVLLSEVTNAFVDDARGEATIVDDESTISFVDYVTGPEGNTGTTAFRFAVTLSSAYDVPVTVEYATADLTPDEEYWYGPGATAGVDYTARTGTVTFNPGEPLTQDIIVLVTGDWISESSELFFVNLSNPTFAQLDSTQALGQIEDDEPYVYIGDGGTVVEGNSGTKSMTFTITLSAATAAPVTVTYATADNSATVAGSDYQAKTGTVTFNPGEPLTQTITVLVNGDRVGESIEYFYVTLSGATGAHLGNSVGSGTIQDDEPRFSIGDVTKAEGKNRTTTLFTFTVTLSAAYDQAVTTSYRTVNGSANTSDYTAKTGTLTFAPGETTKTITIEVKGDNKREADEYFYLDLFGNSSNAWFNRSRGIGSILNDD